MNIVFIIDKLACIFNFIMLRHGLAAAENDKQKSWV